MAEGTGVNDGEVIVAGAGLWGCTVARRLAESGRRVLVLEKRSAVGGNCRCETDPETGIECHTYGSHIFHTSNAEVWKFVNRFVSFNAYRHAVLARHAGKIYHLPIGCTLLKEFFGRDLRPSELNDADRAAIFEAFIRGYTSKQWGVPPEQVDPSVIARLKVRDGFSTDYFDDPWQGIPTEGYNALFERMLDHPGIEVRTGSSLHLEGDRFVLFDEGRKASEPLSVDGQSRRLFYSGPLDALFGHRFGALPWRSLRFETERLPCADAQGNSVVNYVDRDIPFTRQHEYKHYHPEWKDVMASPFTVVSREYSVAWRDGLEPYYPIASEASAALYARYRTEAARVPGLTVGGRLGGYRYFDMDQTIAEALALTADLATGGQ